MSMNRTKNNNINQGQPIRLSSVNFENVFTNNRLNMNSLLSQNMYKNNQNGSQPDK